MAGIPEISTAGAGAVVIVQTFIHCFVFTSFPKRTPLDVTLHKHNDCGAGRVESRLCWAGLCYGLDCAGPAGLAVRL